MPFRPSPETRRQLDALNARYGTDQTVITVAIDRMYREDTMSPKTAELFWAPSLPNHWIAFSSDRLWVMFPATDNGWEKRVPYSGPLSALQP
jgi:hypothetical protein